MDRNVQIFGVEEIWSRGDFEIEKYLKTLKKSIWSWDEGWANGGERRPAA